MKTKLLHALGVLVACGGVLATGLALFKPSPQPAYKGLTTATNSRRAASDSRVGEIRRLSEQDDRRKSACSESCIAGFGVPDALVSASEQDWNCPEKGALLRKAVADWALQDIEACIKWLKGLPQPLSGNLSQDVAGSLMGESALTAFMLLNELPPGPKNDEMMRQAAMAFATADLEAARQWADSQPDSATCELLWSAVATVMAYDQPEQAVAAAAKNLDDSAVRDRVTVEIVQRWMQKDVQAAADFALTMSGDAGVAAAYAVSSYWCRLSPESCESWIRLIPSPDSRISAFSAYVDHRILSDRAGLQRLQAEMTDPGLQSILENALRR